LPEETSLNDLVSVAHLRWRIERDYQELKQELGLGHYEGRGWRGFHHHATLTIAAYGFLMTEQLAARSNRGSKKTYPKSLATPSACRTRRLRPSRKYGARKDTCPTRSRHCVTRSALNCSHDCRDVLLAADQTVHHAL
jgi:hypothetical protein